MLFQRIKRSDPEKIFAVVKNSWSTASLTNGQPVQWDFTTDADGVGVTRPTARATNAGLAVAGVAAGTIASGEYGLIQVYGYHSATWVRNITGGSPAVAAGSPLALGSAGSVFTLENYSTGSDAILVVPCAFALEAQASWSTKQIAVFIKAL
jgi:hypothetical protein